MPVVTGGLPGTPVPDVRPPVAATEPAEDKGSDSSFQWLRQSDEVERLFGTSSAPSPSAACSEMADDEWSETTEENSVQSSSESEMEEGVEKHSDLKDVPSDYVINNKSLVLHYV